MESKEQRPTETAAVSATIATPLKTNITTTPASISPSSSTSPGHDLDTPLAMEPSPEAFPLHHQVYLEGIPEHLGSSSNSSPPKAGTQEPQQQPQSPQLLSFDNDSFESLLSSLDDEDQLSLADEDSFYFTPMEDVPFHRMDRLKRELKLRSELLQYLARDQPPAYVEQLAQQEEVVQQMTLQAAQIKENERVKRRAERRRQRRESTPHPSSFENNSTGNNPDGKSDSSPPVTPKSLFETTAQPPKEQPRSLPLSSYWDFEWHHGLPALASLLLACVAHAALYELVLALVLVCMQPFLSYRILRDSDDRILDAGRNSTEDLCYGVVLVVGLLLARGSGLLFSFDETKKVQPHEDPHRIDRQWAQWMYSHKKGRRVKSFLDVLSFYLCFVAVMYFLGRFALCVDQRASLFGQMPSSNNNSSRTLLLQPATGLPSLDISSSNNGICPVRVQDILLPGELAKVASSSSDSDSSSDDDDEDSDDRETGKVHWDLPQCDDHEVDDYDNPIVWEGGQEDEAYLYERLSASAYHQFFGYGYRAALFDLPHQLMLNFVCSVVSIYALRRYFGCSFWEDW